MPTICRRQANVILICRHNVMLTSRPTLTKSDICRPCADLMSTLCRRCISDSHCIDIERRKTWMKISVFITLKMCWHNITWLTSYDCNTISLIQDIYSTIVAATTRLAKLKVFCTFAQQICWLVTTWIESTLVYIKAVVHWKNNLITNTEKLRGRILTI